MTERLRKDAAKALKGMDTAIDTGEWSLAIACAMNLARLVHARLHIIESYLDHIDPDLWKALQRPMQHTKKEK